MQCIEDHIETAVEGQDSECSTEAEFCPFEERTRLEELEEQANNEQEQEQEETTMDSDDTDQNDSEDDDVVRVGGVEYPITARKEKTNRRARSDDCCCGSYSNSDGGRMCGRLDTVEEDRRLD